MGRGRPKGSRNKNKFSIQELLEQAYLPVVSMFIRQALQGEFASQRVVLDLIQSLPRKRSIRSGNMQNVEDLLRIAKATMQQLNRGEITGAEGKTTMQALDQMSQLFEQQAQEKKSQRPRKELLPDFMRSALAVAMPYADSGARIVIFYDRVDPLVRGHGAPQATVLGYVLAHEIAHVLQGIARHSETGIMRARWTNNDFKQMGAKVLLFTPEDVQLIRQRLAPRDAPAGCSELLSAKL